jgi:hypothetical protein
MNRVLANPAQLASGSQIAPNEPEAQTQLALLAELAASLEAGQKALLEKDLDTILASTNAQARLIGALRILWTRPEDPTASQPGNPREKSTSSSAAFGDDLHAAQARVLQLGRVQAALLNRAGRSLRTLARLIAGPGATYSPAPNLPPHFSHERKEAGVCRV